MTTRYASRGTSTDASLDAGGDASRSAPEPVLTAPRAGDPAVLSVSALLQTLAAEPVVPRAAYVEMLRAAARLLNLVADEASVARPTPARIAALFVEADGIYAGRADIDPWDVKRDARLYEGPLPVVTHPPCARWSKMWTMGGRFGEDEGCFAAALRAVETWGGVIEHPADSGAWTVYGLPRPSRDGGWMQRAGRPGWACHVEQGNYGHRARKATWLYWCPRGSVAARAPRTPIQWGAAPQRGVWVTGSQSLPPGYEVLDEVERRSTPHVFAELLVALALESVAPDAPSSLENVAMPAARMCAWCGGPFRQKTRSHAQTCKKSCRQAIQRWRAQGRSMGAGSVVELRPSEASASAARDGKISENLITPLAPRAFR